jgi:hypothetical protein
VVVAGEALGPASAPSGYEWRAIRHVLRGARAQTTAFFLYFSSTVRPGGHAHKCYTQRRCIHSFWGGVRGPAYLDHSRLNSLASNHKQSSWCDQTTTSPSHPPAHPSPLVPCSSPTSTGGGPLLPHGRLPVSPAHVPVAATGLLPVPLPVSRPAAPPPHHFRVPRPGHPLALRLLLLLPQWQQG